MHYVTYMFWGPLHVHNYVIVLDYGLIAGVCVIVMNFHSLILQLFRFKFFGVYYTVQKKFLSVSKQRH